MARPLKKAKIGPGEFEIVCPHCQIVQKRSLWSIAHLSTVQTGACESCKQQFVVPASR